MANLFFPQLLTGALVQYPLRKVKQIRTVANVYGDGSMTVYPDTGASRILWAMQYSGISSVELAALQNLYASCSGPLVPFTFIDPVDNMLISSANVTASQWNLGPGCTCRGGAADPQGGATAFNLTNASQAGAGISQTLQVPANYVYCFSVYAKSSASAALTLQLSGASTSQSQSFVLPSEWTRVNWSARLNDPGDSITASLTVPPGTSVEVFGPQLEPQPAASSYKPTLSRGGVYANCHWTNSTLPVTALGPNVYAIEIGIETSF